MSNPFGSMFDGMCCMAQVRAMVSRRRVTRIGSVLTRLLTQDKGAFQRVMTPGDNNLCGVGINFKPDMTGALEVHSVVPGSPAAAETKIKQGDLLEQVNHSV